MGKFRKIIVILVLVACVLPVKVRGFSAECAILADATTGKILYEKQADKQSLIASTTKIMTALVVCEQCNVLDRMRIPREAVGIEGSSMYLQEGEILTVQELLYGLMLRSGNDAAVALAIYCGGTVGGFAELMNDKASGLGLKNTHFVNPNGLDAPDHYSTARDLAILAAYAMENPIFARTVSAKTVTVGSRSLKNHNKLLWQVEGADGVKTGYTKSAGRILVSSATRQGRRLVAVTINDADDWADHTALLNTGFSRYQEQTVIRQGEVVGRVEIAGGQAGSAELIADADFCYALAQDEKTETTYSGTGFVYAPVVKGQDAGCVYVCLGNKTVGKVPVVYGETVEMTEEEKKPSFWDRIFNKRGA